MPQWYRTALLMPLACSLSIPTSLCLALAVLTASVRPARAAPNLQPTPDPVLVWPSETARDTEALETALRDAGHPVLPFAPIGEALRRGRATHRAFTQSKLAAIEEGLARAQDLYLAQSWDAMLAELSSLQRGALGILARPEGCGTLWELEFRRGLGHGARKGDNDSVDRTEHFAAAFTLDATRRPLGDLYGPDVSAAFLAAVEAASARPARPTTITVTPADAQVTVDCRVVDATVAVPLVPGRHTVLVEAPGFQPHVETFLLSAGDPVTVTLAADETPDPLQRLALTWSNPSLSPRGIASRSAIADVATAQGALRWVVLVPTEQGTRASLWREDGRGTVLEMADEEAAARGVLEPRRRRKGGALAPTIGPANPAVTGSPRGGTDKGRKPLVRRWWFWTALLGGAAATGLGLGLGLRRDPTPKRLEVVVR